MTQQLSIGAARLPLSMLTRHVLIAGATGSGKTVTAASLIEQMGTAGVPVLVLDAKGDLGALASPGRHISPKSIGGQLNLLRMGCDLVARALDLTGPQAGALEIALAFAEDSAITVATLADLRALLSAVMEGAEPISHKYGLLSLSSVAAVQRAILRLERAGGAAIFGPKAFDPFTCTSGITVMHAAPLADIPGLYGAAVAHWLSVLQREARELGQVARPVLSIFIDESHLVFDGATDGVVREIERSARLLRSKGISLTFASQSPADIPDGIAAQILSRIQHGLRATTPNQLRAVRSAADSFGPGIKPEHIEALATGEALCRLPDASGRLIIATREKIKPGCVHLVGIEPPISSPPSRPVADFSDRQPPKPSPAKVPYWRMSNPGAWAWGIIGGCWALAILGALASVAVA